jgi:hypothetical protein
MIRLFALAAVCTLSACVPASAPPSSGGGVAQAPQPQPVPQPTVQPQPTTTVYHTDWTYWPVTPGDWVYRRDERGSIALFGPLGQDALATLRCDTSRQMLYFSRAGQVSGTTQMTLRASQGLQNYIAGQVPGTPYVAAAIQPSDAMLDKLAYSRGRFVVEVAGLPPLKLPSWAEVARVIEDCRK